MKNKLLFLIPMTAIILCGCKNRTASTFELREYDEYALYLKYHPEYKGSLSDYLSAKGVLRQQDTIAKSKIKNIIFVIGDGMSFGSIYGGELYSNKKFEFTNWAKFVGNTNSLDEKTFRPTTTTDSAAAATALATGSLTVNGVVGRDKDQTDLETFFDVAKAKGQSLGVVTTDALSGATPAGFSAHAKNRGDAEDILTSQATSKVDLFIGVYNGYYEEKASVLENKGYTYKTNLDETALGDQKIVINNKDMTAFGGQNTLIQSTKYAVDYLSKNTKGFSLMIEQAYIDKYAHHHDFENNAKSMIELNNTIDYLIDRFKNQDDTLIVVTADHDNGGLRVSEKTNLKNKITVDGREFSYNFKYQGHSQEYVPIYINKPVLDFEFLGVSNEEYVVKNSEIAKSIKALLNR